MPPRTLNTCSTTMGSNARGIAEAGRAVLQEAGGKCQASFGAVALWLAQQGCVTKCTDLRGCPHAPP
eukprot:12067092-Alexandrium_andersonii.AAC.1